MFSGCAGALETLRIQFDRQHCIRLPQVVEPELAHLIQREIDKAEFYKRVHKDAGVPPPVDLCMTDNNTSGLLYFLINDPFLFKLIQQITGCPQIGCFSGAIYRLVPGLGYDSWHNDVGEHRMVAMSINLSTDIYSGGILQLRDKNSQRIVHEVANIGVGDGIIFRISPDLEHRVSNIEGTVARTAFAGWFRTEPDFLSVLKKDSLSLSQDRLVST